VHPSTDTKQLREELTRFLEPLSMSGTLKDAYMLQSAGVDPTTDHLEGLVLTVAGDAPASVFTASHLLGYGTTWLRVQDSDGSEVDEQRIIKQFRTLPAEFSGMRVSLVSGLDFPDKAHYVVVEGNDSEVAAEVHERALAHSIEDLVQGPMAMDYQRLVTSSFERRAAAAAEFMRVHQLELDSSMPTGNQLTHYIEHAHALSVQSKSSRQLSDNTFVAYVGAIDPSQTHSGVMVYRGSIAGYTHMRLRQSKTVKGAPSSAWENSSLKAGRPFSMFPASTGLFVEGSARAADRHKNMSERVRRAHSERVRWSGAVATYNPRADAIYHAVNDAHWIQASSELGVAPGGAVVSTDFNTVVTEVPPIETRHMRLAQLADVLENSQEKEMLVNTRSVVKWLNSYSKADQMDLGALFATQEGDVVTLKRTHIEKLHAAGVE
jgi:hypothetical protein